jgi:DNA-binding GntR family transcriptional regulator
MTASFASPTPLDRRISLALAHLRAARYDSNPRDITTATRQMNDLLEHIACRPLGEIDQALDQHLRVSFKHSPNSPKVNT